MKQFSTFLQLHRAASNEISLILNIQGHQLHSGVINPFRQLGHSHLIRGRISGSVQQTAYAACQAGFCMQETCGSHSCCNLIPLHITIRRNWQYAAKILPNKTDHRTCSCDVLWLTVTLCDLISVLLTSLLSLPFLSSTLSKYVKHSCWMWARCFPSSDLLTKQKQTPFLGPTL